MSVLGHAGDVVSSLIMIGPVFVVLGWLGIQVLRDKLSGEDVSDHDKEN